MTLKVVDHLTLVMVVGDGTETHSMEVDSNSKMHQRMWLGHPQGVVISAADYGVHLWGHAGSVVKLFLNLRDCDSFVVTS